MVATNTIVVKKKKKEDLLVEVAMNVPGALMQAMAIDAVKLKEKRRKKKTCGVSRYTEGWRQVVSAGGE